MDGCTLYSYKQNICTQLNEMVLCYLNRSGGNLILERTKYEIIHR